MSAREEGFTLIETLVTMALFALVSVGFYQVMIATVGASNTTSDLTRISEEARHGFNRILRDTREAAEIRSAAPNAYRIWVDFDGDEEVDADDYELVQFEYLAGGRIELVALNEDGTEAERALLVDSVSPALDGEGDPLPVFSYSSDYLQYDTDTVDGVSSLAELTAAVGADRALDYISNVHIDFRVAVGDSSSTFTSRAQLRNKRFGL